MHSLGHCLKRKSTVFSNTCMYIQPCFTALAASRRKGLGVSWSIHTFLIVLQFSPCSTKRREQVREISTQTQVFVQHKVEETLVALDYNLVPTCCILPQLHQFLVVWGVLPSLHKHSVHVLLNLVLSLVHRQEQMRMHSNNVMFFFFIQSLHIIAHLLSCRLFITEAMLPREEDGCGVIFHHTGLQQRKQFLSILL